MAYAIELRDTINDMCSVDYKDRFIAEYWQNKIRYEKLKDFCTKIEAAPIMGKEEPKHDVPLFMLQEQQNVMGQYLHMLELRAVIENIDLHLCIKSK